MATIAIRQAKATLTRERGGEAKKTNKDGVGRSYGTSSANWFRTRHISS